ncbi:MULTISPECIES: hypothetical protein [unclassified Salinivibrio]|uniref:hypothetical protein n=1 Tax=unclassified Salinivibrio TaxID=2636825 RepID=UPI000986F267|nr:MULTISPECIES: hypothetical protein [unclassified Salinivibrio]OOF10258.1 hypothetical protein BZG83_14140 [Salinivibrio sp. PR919]OOF18511.1 hypothetical protein BZG84_03445 [Salinivibrio sp. PR932]
MSKIPAPSKAELCLLELLRRGKAGLHPLDVNIRDLTHANVLDEAGKYWSITLPTDMSLLRIRHGVRIADQPAPFTSVRGYKAMFKRYWLADLDAAKNAIRLINSWRAKRGAKQLSKCSCDTLLAAFQSEPQALGEVA